MNEHMSPDEMEGMLDGLAVASSRTRTELNAELAELRFLDQDDHLTLAEAMNIHDLPTDRQDHVNGCTECQQLANSIYVSDLGVAAFEAKVHELLSNEPRHYGRLSHLAAALAGAAVLAAIGIPALSQFRPRIDAPPTSVLLPMPPRVIAQPTQAVDPGEMTAGPIDQDSHTPPTQNDHHQTALTTVHQPPPSKPPQRARHSHSPKLPANGVVWPCASESSTGRFDASAAVGTNSPDRYLAVAAASGPRWYVKAEPSPTNLPNSTTENQDSLDVLLALYQSDRSLVGTSDVLLRGNARYVSAPEFPLTPRERLASYYLERASALLVGDTVRRPPSSGPRNPR